MGVLTSATEKGLRYQAAPPQHPSANTQASTGRVGEAEGQPPPPPPPPGPLPSGREKSARSGAPASPRRPASGEMAAAFVRGLARRALRLGPLVNVVRLQGTIAPRLTRNSQVSPPGRHFGVLKRISGDALPLRGRAEERLAFPFPARPDTAFHPDPEGRPRLPRSAARRARAAEGGRRRRPLRGGRRR